MPTGITPKDLRVPTSEQLYDIREKEINTELKELKKVLKDHKQRHLNDPKNYGYAGDLGSMLDYLRDINDQFRPVSAD